MYMCVCVCVRVFVSFCVWRSVVPWILLGFTRKERKKQRKEKSWRALPDSEHQFFCTPTIFFLKYLKNTENLMFHITKYGIRENTNWRMLWCWFWMNTVRRESFWRVLFSHVTKIIQHLINVNSVFFQVMNRDINENTSPAMITATHCNTLQDMGGNCNADVPQCSMAPDDKYWVIYRDLRLISDRIVLFCRNLRIVDIGQIPKCDQAIPSHRNRCARVFPHCHATAHFTSLLGVISSRFVANHLGSQFAGQYRTLHATQLLLDCKISCHYKVVYRAVQARPALAPARWQYRRTP